jgi:4-hydroxy-4-methyl-2-oxoglutarate aldolase
MSRNAVSTNGRYTKKKNQDALKQTLAALREFDGALLANTVGYIDPTPAHECYMGGSIQPMTRMEGSTIGVAVTCEMDSSSPNRAAEVDGFWRQLDEIQATGLPVIWVVKSIGPRPDHECVAGDGMGKALHASGCVGIVTDGRVRDLKGLAGIPLPVFAKGISIHHSPMRIPRINCPVEVGGITVRPGDILHGSAEGVVRIPKTCLNKLAEAAIRMWGFERDAHAIFSRPDLTATQKKERVLEILAAYKFAGPGTPAKKREAVN